MHLEGLMGVCGKESEQLNRDVAEGKGQPARRPQNPRSFMSELRG